MIYMHYTCHETIDRQTDRPSYKEAHQRPRGQQTETDEVSAAQTKETDKDER